MIGTTVSHYRITAELGAGGMGVVYEAEDTDLGRTVALKFLPAHLGADAEARRRLQHEARAAAALHHPGICTVHEIGEADGRLFIAMALCEGRTLEQRLAEGPLAVDAALDLAIGLAEALAHAHQGGVVHRDLKPGNVMLDPDGRPVLMDFGLARAADRSRLTVAGSSLGTPRYMSPEQAQGDDADHRTDLWSLGVILYEALAGRPPFAGEREQAVVYAILNVAPEPLTDLNREVPYALEDIVERCLQKDPEARYQNAAQLADDLRALRDELASGERTRQAAPLRKLRRRLRPRMVVPALAAVAVVLVVGLRLFLAAADAIDAIAVLPCVDMSEAGGEELLAAGMTDGLITELQRLCGHDVRVIGRTSVMRFANSDKGLPEIAAELGVDALVEATVVSVGDMVRVAAKLIRARPEEQLWVESFERRIRDVRALHGDVARMVAQQIQVALAPEQEERLDKKRSVDPEAYRLVALGTREWNEGTAEGIEKSEKTFRKAVDLEPEYVEALAGLANALAALGCQGIRHPSTVYPEARRVLNRALVLDPTNPEALASLGHMTWECDWDFREAERLLRMALDENPSYVLARHMLGFMLVMIGRPEEGLGELERAYDLDPLSPRLTVDLGALLIRNGDAARGKRLLERARSEFPEWDATPLDLQRCVENGEYDRAIDLVKERDPDPTNRQRLARISSLNLLKGDTASSRAALAQLVALADTTFVPPTLIFNRYNQLGDIDQAVTWLEKALEIRDPGLARSRWLVDHPDPRVAAIGRQVGFE